MCSFSGVLLTFYIGRGCAFFAFDFQEKRASVKWRKPVIEWERWNIGICQVAFSNTNLTTGWKDEWDVYSPGRGAKCLWIMAILLIKYTTCVPLGIVKHRHMKLHFFVNDLKCSIWNRKVNSWRCSEDIRCNQLTSVWRMCFMSAWASRSHSIQQRRYDSWHSTLTKTDR